MIYNKKKILYTILILTVILILIILYYKYKTTKIDLNNVDVIINKHRIWIIENNERVNYLTLENFAEGIIVNREKLNKLKQYLKDNNLKIKPGRYEIEDVYSFKKILRILRFESDL